MVKLNMANMNTLFRKVYFLAGVVMAANMLVVNEVKASDSEDTYKIDSNANQEQDENKKEGNSGVVQGFLNLLLSHENIINLFGGLAFSCVNNYFKWWDYNPGWYGQFGCFGWRSGRFIKDIFQFEVNFINLGRGAFWTILGTYNLIKGLKKEDCAKSLYVSYLVAVLINKKHMSRIALIGVFLIQGFISLPLTLHFFNFSISLSLDSMIWGVIGIFLGKEADGEEGKDNNSIIFEENISPNIGENGENKEILNNERKPDN